MHMNARIYVADILDEVFIEATVFVVDHAKEPAAEVITYQAQCKGVGEEVPHEWLKEALITLIETL